MKDKFIDLEILEIQLIVEGLKNQLEIMRIENKEREVRNYPLTYGAYDFSRIGDEYIKLIERVKKLKSDTSDK